MHILRSFQLSIQSYWNERVPWFELNFLEIQTLPMFPSYVEGATKSLKFSPSEKTPDALRYWDIIHDGSAVPADAPSVESGSLQDDTLEKWLNEVRPYFFTSFIDLFLGLSGWGEGAHLAGRKKI